MSGSNHDDEDAEKTVIQTPGSGDGTSESAEDADANGDTSEDSDDDEEDRTVIQPGPAPTDDGEDEQRTVIAPATPTEGSDEDRTVIAPAGASEATGDPLDRTVIEPAGAAAAPSPPPPPPPPPKTPKTPISGITIGQVLNHTYEVKRFIARGGMGEVFEGVNVTNGQRVAIKVILPALASDPAVIEMFVKEATVLERLVHPALVNYRTQARDPEAGVFYIVTNYIEGTSLEKLIGKITPTLEEIVGLTRRLAEGLGVAHSLGAIHRDIAPDNILLEQDKLSGAQIIDFGIARDIDPGSNTVIGTGFAGKYSFVAPEQLGAFKSDVGAWSDIYSLGLVLLGLVRGATLKLGTSPVEANDVRKEGIDTSDVPRALRPLLDAMLVYDPAQRLRSMDGVLAMLDAVDLTDVEEDGTAIFEPEDPGEVDFVPDGEMDEPVGEVPLHEDGDTIAGLPRKAVFAGGGVLALIIFGGLGMIAFGGSDDGAIAGGGGGTSGGAPAITVAIDAATATQRAQAALGSASCHWLDLSVTGQPGALQLAANGVAGQPGAIEPVVFGALESGGVSTDFSGVSPIPQVNCPAINAMRPFRATGEPAITQPQPRSELERFPANYEIPGLAGKTGARHAVDINLPGDTPIAALAFSEGEIGVLGADTVLNLLGPESRQSAGQFRVNTISEADAAGWTSVILLEGGGQLGAAASALEAGQFDSFRQLAEANGINVHIVWHQLVDDTPN